MAGAIGKVNEVKSLVSVIVPIYKVESYLRKCVDSIINQTYTNLEIILINDGSPDNCPALCDEYAAKDSRIRVIHKKNGGIASARNAGLSVYTGDYVMFVDSDDWLSDSYIMSMKDAIRNNDWVIAGVTYVKNGCQVIVEPKENLMELVKSSLLGYVWNKMYKRQLIRDFDLTLKQNEDFIFNLHVLAESDRFSITQDTGYFYLQHDESILHTIHRDEDERIIAFCYALTNVLNDIDLPHGKKEQIFNFAIFTALSDGLCKIVASDMSLAEKNRKCNALFAYPSFRNGLKFKYANNSLYLMTALALKAKSGKLFRVLYEACNRHKGLGGI